MKAVNFSIAISRQVVDSAEWFALDDEKGAISTTKVMVSILAGRMQTENRDF